MPHVFISYTAADVDWAEWIAWVLEEKGYRATIQQWDFRPGCNFVVEMQKAAVSADLTLAVISPKYLDSGMASAEWAAAFAEDPTGMNRKLIPVRIQEVGSLGLLKSVVYIDLVGKPEVEARDALLKGIAPGRSKPNSAPPFPGQSHNSKPFPGARRGIQNPQLRLSRPPSDLDRRNFLRRGFEEIVSHFSENMSLLEQENSGLETTVDRNASFEFRAEIYLHGQLKANCRIWIGGMMSENSISYSEGATAQMGNALNETLTIKNGTELAFSAMGSSWHTPNDININAMSAEDAARYLWVRFFGPLTV